VSADNLLWRLALSISLRRESHRTTEAASVPEEPESPVGHKQLAQVEREAEAQMRDARRTVWLSVLLAAGMWSVLIVWAILAPRLGGRAHLFIGIAVGTEAVAMGFLLAIYAHSSQVRALEHYLDRLRELALQLQETSDRDSLTGLYNHGYLLRRLQEEISLAQRHMRSLSVVILDLDEFKEVNDRYGHLVGDEVLQLVAATIRKQVREHDIVARYGGDEFCLVLPETRPAGAGAVVEKLRAAVAALSERLQEWADSPIGFGCGVSTYPAEGSTVRQLISHADAQLYEEKRVQHLERARQAQVRPPSGEWVAPPAGTADREPPAASMTA
jgi:diguanylate cyclase (GGDEF)-like protein